MGRKAPAKQELARRLRVDMTPAEKVLWAHLRSNGLNGLAFRRQQVIDGFIADFYCHAAALVVEVDGDVHAAQIPYDQERSEVLGRRGIAVLRFTNEQVLNEVSTVRKRITQTAQARLPKKP